MAGHKSFRWLYLTPFLNLLMAVGHEKDEIYSNWFVLCLLYDVLIVIGFAIYKLFYS